VLLGKHFLPFQRNVVPSSERVQRSEMNVFHFVAVNLPLTSGRLQCVLFNACHYGVHY
jgi:hypothetical protein